MLSEKFALLNYKNVKRGALDQLWQKRNVLTPHNLLASLLSEESIRQTRAELRKITAVLVSPEEVVGAVRRLLNEAAAAEMDAIKICLPVRKARRSRGKTERAEGETPTTAPSERERAPSEESR